jgi:hypothetical protein
MLGKPRIRFGSTVIRSRATGQGYGAPAATSLRCQCKGGIGPNPHASMAFEALVPQMEAICGDGLILFRRPAPDPTRPRAGIREKRLMGFEPTTFCMASRRSSQLSYSRAEGDSSLMRARPLSEADVSGGLRRVTNYLVTLNSIRWTVAWSKRQLEDQ